MLQCYSVTMLQCYNVTFLGIKKLPLCRGSTHREPFCGIYIEVGAVTDWAVLAALRANPVPNTA